RAWPLAARRTCNRAARHDGDLFDGQPEYIADPSADAVGQRVRRDRAARLDDDHDAIGMAMRDDAECNNSSPAHTGEIADRPFEILGVVLAAVDDDDVLRPAA